MRNCPRRASPAVARGCDTELCAANAKEKAIACLSTVVRPRCNSKVLSDSSAHVQRRTLGIPAECLAAFSGATAPAIEWMTTMTATKGNVTAPIAASVVLQRLHDLAPTDHFTLGWLMSGWPGQTFLWNPPPLCVVAIAPGASIVAGVFVSQHTSCQRRASRHFGTASRTGAKIS